jgi:hypothetical protein
LTAEDNPPPPDRESIWSISPRWRTVYFTLFVIQNVAGISLVCWFEIFHRTEDSLIQTILNIIQGSGQITVGSAGITLTLTEGARLIMVLGEQLDRWFKKREQDRVDRAVAATIAKATAKATAEATAKATAEATAETQRKWTEWNNRRMDAEAMGEPFDESPPSFDSASANGTQ